MRGTNIKLVLVMMAMIMSFCGSSYVPWGYSEFPRPQRKLFPCEIMVDVTNDLAYKTLHYHSIANPNNFAFSPTALASVLIALYEGSHGRGSVQIQNALGLPWNTDVIRIGYRDIHRRLRTYFFGLDNPLSGLSLNKENVTITREYESILTFYGYDLGDDMVSLDKKINDTEPVEEMKGTLEKPTTSYPLPASTVINTSSTTATSPDILSTISDVTTTTIDTTSKSTMTTTTTTTQVASEELETTLTTTIPENIISTTDLPTENLTEIITEMPLITAETSFDMNYPKNDSTTMITSTEQIDTTTLVPRETTYIRTFRPILNTTPLRSFETTTELPVKSTTQQSSPYSANPSPLFPSRRRPGPDSLRRAKRSFSLPYPNPNSFEFTFVADPEPLLELELYDVDAVYYTPRDIARDQIIKQAFYLNSLETIQTTYKVYNTILNHIYIDALRTSVLEVNLDTKDYTLLIFLPDHTFGIDFLLSSIKSAPTLRTIRRSLQSKWIQAIIPDFKMKGRTFLTSDMQFLGITDIFEPLRADFSPMTGDRDVYAKHIEQTIDVHIRTKPVDQLKRDIGPFSRPLEVSVNHPFLFFIVDKELDVAIIAGSVLNPLNVRIQ